MGAWMGWQSYLAKKYPDAYQPKVAEKKVSENGQANSTAPAATQLENSATPQEASTLETKKNNQTATEQLRAETRQTYADTNWAFEISSHGMAIKNLKLAQYSDRKNQPITFAQDEDLSLFATGLIGQRIPLDFNIKKTGETQFVGEARIGDMLVTKIYNIESKDYIIKTQVRVENINNQFTGLVTQFSDRVQEIKSSFLMPQFDFQEFYIFHNGTADRTHVDLNKPVVETFNNSHVVSFGGQYFAAAVVDQSDILPEFRATTTLDANQPRALGTLTYNHLSTNKSMVLNYTSFAGPKSYELLKAVDPDLADMINFGFFRSIAKAIFWLMKSIHSVIGNWGVAIIFLTIIVRILVLPFNIIGYKQMKAMQAIQPQIKNLREKYKNDQQKLNQEMLTLMKEAKANPIGGCLPMFLQIPVFFALYQVIGHSIELYKAPFLFWISDLSVKDPFFVLPVLMGVTMFIQQKITPNTLEPAQQKVLLFLPVFFSFLMLTLPSGLTLYIFISTVFGVIQQIYFMKDNTTNLVKTS